MPIILAALLVIVLVILASVLLIPFTLWGRYRAGTARRRARRWVATLNLVGITISSAIFLFGAALTNVWVPEAFLYAASGLVGGVAIGVVGLGLTRWERTPSGLHYTPNRWLVLALTLAVSARLAYGLWRSWNAWMALAGDAGWIAAAGVGGSLAAGAVILGYYLAFWTGIRMKAPA